MATSGTIKTDFSGGYRLQIVWKVNRQDIERNASDVTASVQLVSLGAGYNIISSATKYGSLSINGIDYSFTFKADLTGNQTKTLFSKTVTVNHKADGSKVCEFSCACALNVTLSGVYVGTVEASGTGTFNAIPRATVPTITGSPVMGSPITINTPRASGSFTHTLRYVFGILSGTIATNVNTSAEWTIPLSLANAVPNGLAGTGSIICDTYNGATLIGSKSITFTAAIPASVVPVISEVSIAEAVPGIASKFAGFVQGQSKLLITVKASGAYGSTIRSYRTTVEGVAFTADTFTTGVLSSSGQIEIVTTVTDSRGRTQTARNTITVAAYTFPEILTFSGMRCTAEGLPDDEGTNLSAAISFSISSLSAKNDKAYKLEYREASAATWTQLDAGNVYEYNDTYLNTTGLLNADKPYQIRLTVSDYFGSVAMVIEIPTAVTLMDLHSSGRGIAFGKVAEIANLFDVAWAARFRGRVTLDDVSGIPQLADSGWLDLPLKTGWTYQYDTDKPQYRKIGSTVYLRGLVDATAAAGTTLGELPEGYRPIGQYNRFPCTLNQKEFANVQVGRNGLITDYTKTTSAARALLCLNGISFLIN